VVETKDKPSDAQILELAQEIVIDEGLSLVDAMIMAEEKLMPRHKDAPPEGFAVYVKVKPRVARWIVQEFGGHAELSIEDRLGAYLATVLNRMRIKAIRLGEASPSVGNDGAVSVRRAAMAKIEGDNS